MQQHNVQLLKKQKLGVLVDWLRTLHCYEQPLQPQDVGLRAQVPLLEQVNP